MTRTSFHQNAIARTFEHTIPHVTPLLLMHRLLLPVIAISLMGGCGSGDTGPAPLEVSWTRLGEYSWADDGVEAFVGVDERHPLRAWYVRADILRSDVSVDVVAADDEDGRMTVTEFARATGACAAVNGGYFRMDAEPSTHVGLLVSGGRIVSHSTTGVYRNDLRYTVTRATLGFDKADSAAIGWTASRNDTVFVWNAPLPNRSREPVTSLDLASARLWSVEDAVSGGPAIVRDGRTHIAVEEEVFFDTAIPDIHPRTAAGITANGDLILMVVDGRQGTSRGVDLENLAGLMLEAGAQHAINLDGGGSSALVLDGQLINTPSGGTTEREVVSSIVVRCREK
ncbi:MAG: phosphodiester glycosidase family protein [Rhodothermales bacterium]|nr:phosphodiester glycosidase family protein [Rhodothermales bacterium]